jgi:2-haloacid dehalogenase
MFVNAEVPAADGAGPSHKLAGSPQAVVFDVGRVLIEWDLRHLFAKLIDDGEQLDWFLANVVTEDWHYQHDAGRPLSEMVAERKALFPAHAHLIDAYRARFLETIPAQVPGTYALLERLAARGIPLFALTNFGAEFWPQYRATEPRLRHFRDIVVSGDERCAKPDPTLYAIAERRFGLPPHALLFTDDKQENLDAAAARGWHTHLFTGAEGLEARLIELSLLD